MEDQVTQESADEGSDDPQDDGHQDGDVLSARHDQPGERAGDQTDDDDADDETEHVVPPGRMVAVGDDHGAGRGRAGDQLLADQVQNTTSGASPLHP